jgi:protein O-mannosyl-transferase
MRRKLKKTPPELPAPVRRSAVDRRAPGFAAADFTRYSTLAVSGLLLLSVIVVFGQTAGHEFVNFDDADYVYKNRHVCGGLAGAEIAWAFSAFHSGNWHPLTWLSHMLDCQLFDLHAGGHHLTNVLLHAAAAIYVFLVLERLTAARWRSACVAALFAIHPLRVESVAWVAERKDVLSGLFFMLSLWFYARYAERPNSRGWYGLVLASFALGLMAKPMLVTLPFVLLLLDYWPLGRRVGLRALIVEKIPFFVLAAASCLVTLAAQREAMRTLQNVDLSARLANAAIAYSGYLGKMFYPVELAAFYPLPKDPPPAWKALGAITLLFVITAAVFAARRKRPYLLFGWLWYIGALVPVIGAVQVGNQALADRYTYLPQIGISIALVWAVADFALRHSAARGSMVVLTSLLLSVLAVLAWQQTTYWRNSEILWTHASVHTLQNPVVEFNLGSALEDRNQFDEAIVHYRAALQLNPDYVDALNNLGRILAARGQLDAAGDYYRRALQFSNLAATHYNLGLVAAAGQQIEVAIAEYRKALEIDPELVEAHYNLGTLLAGRGEVGEAIVHLRRAVAIDPGYAEAHYNLGTLLAQSEKIDEAIPHFQKAVQIQPDHLEARRNLGQALALRGRPVEALEQYRQALVLAERRNDAAMAADLRARIASLQSP